LQNGNMMRQGMVLLDPIDALNKTPIITSSKIQYDMEKVLVFIYKTKCYRLFSSTAIK